jgi:CRISPR/Cas system CSM-associated protein Csm2 small subunit
MSRLPTNADSEKMKFLLNKLEDGTLDKDEAEELKQLLQREMQRVSDEDDKKRRDDLQVLITVLDSFISSV